MDAKRGEAACLGASWQLAWELHECLFNQHNTKFISIATPAWKQIPQLLKVDCNAANNTLQGNTKTSSDIAAKLPSEESMFDRPFVLSLASSAAAVGDCRLMVVDEN